MIAVAPDEHLVRTWDSLSTRQSQRKIAQGPDLLGQPPGHRRALSARPVPLVRRGLASERGTARHGGVPDATQFVTPDDIAANIPCGQTSERIVSAVRQFTKAGCTDVALVQIDGDHQRDFFSFAERELLPALRESG